MALAGHQLSSFSGDAEGRDTRFTIFGQSDAGRIETVAVIQRLDGMQAALTLPATLPRDTMYLMWPKNESGYGDAVAINQTEAWWVGFNRVSKGETFSVYGRNLILGSGDCYLYIDGYGWITSDTANPYKADFIVPADLENGTYTVYAHNGHGKEYGWSKPLALTVAAAYPNWAVGTVRNVNSYGADGSDTSDDYAAIAAAYSACNAGDTLYFPAGTYYTSSWLWIGKSIRILGEDRATTTIKQIGTDTISAIISVQADRTVVESITLDSDVLSSVNALGVPGRSRVIVKDCNLKH